MIWKLARWLGVCVLAVAGIVGVTKVLVDLATSQLRVRVSDPVPDMFPVLVVSRDNGESHARIVFSWAVPLYVRHLRNYSFEVPMAERDRLAAEVERRTAVDYLRASGRPDKPAFGVGCFEVEKSSSGWQMLRVEGTWDDDRLNIGWYNASGKNVRPLYYLSYFGPGQVLRVLPLSILVNAFMWVGIVVAWRRICFCREHHSGSE